MINGQPYNVKIIAVYASGEESLPSLVSTATPGTSLAPSGLTVVGGNQKLTVSFTPPESTGGFAVTNYSYDVWPASETTHVENWQALTTPKATSPIVISGLTNGTAYKFKLRAENASGAGQASAEIRGTPKAEVPSAPTITNISAGNASLTVAFNAPETDGGKPITSYKYSINNGVTKLDYTDTLSPIDIENLTNGTKYSVILYAVNEVGVGAPSEAVEGLPSEGTTPSAPLITHVTSGIRQLTVAFTPPVKDNGSAVTRYQYKLNSGRWTTRKPETDLTSPIVITGLKSNTAYKLRLRAINASGAGASSAVTLGKTLKTAPTAPEITSIQFYSGDTGSGVLPHFLIYFKPAADDGGAPITGYVPDVKNFYSTTAPVVDQGTFYALAGTTSGGATYINPSGSEGTVKIFDNSFEELVLPYGAAYYTYADISLSAVNAVGVGDTSITEIWTEDPEGAPLTPPTNVTISALNSTSILISFSPPERNIGPAIVGYKYSLNNGLDYSSTVQAVDDTITVTGLLPGTYYEVRIKAENGNPYSAASAMIRVTTEPEIPTAPTIYAIVGLENSLVVQFSTPVVPGGVILDYEYSLNAGSFVSSGVRSSPITLTGTDNDVPYTVAVRAVNQVGPGTVSNTASGISGSPSEPVITAVQAGKGWLGSGGELKVYFNPPVSDGGSNIIKYHYSVDNGATYTSILNTTTYTESVSPIIISSLENGETYQIMLKAENARSIGQPSQVVSGTPYTTPLEPVLTQVVVDTSKLGTATLYFTPPTFDGGSPIVSYDYTLDDGSVWQNSVSAVIDNFIVLSTSKLNPTEIRVLVRAVNAAGAGRPSNRISARPLTVPTPPLAVELVQIPENPTQLMLRFNPPASNGGAAITHYAYSVYGLPPNESYIPVSALSTPLPYTFTLPNTFSYGNTATVSLRAISFGANTETPITTDSGVSDRSFASIYVVPYTLTMPTDWVQLGTIQYNSTTKRFVQPITLKLPCNPANNYIGKSVQFMQSLATRVDYALISPSTAGSGRVFDRNNISLGDTIQRTSSDAAGTFTFIPFVGGLPELMPNRGEYEFTFTAYNDHCSSAPYTVKTSYTAVDPLPAAALANVIANTPPPDAVKPPEYSGFEVINVSRALPAPFKPTGYDGYVPFQYMSVVEIYVDLENTHMTYSLYGKHGGMNGTDEHGTDEHLTETITLPIAKDYSRFGQPINGDIPLRPSDTLALAFINAFPEPTLFEVWRRTFVPNRETSYTPGSAQIPAGIPFEGKATVGGKQMLTLKIAGIRPGDEAKLIITAKNSAGTSHAPKTIILNTSIDATEPYTMQPVWWAAMGQPPIPYYFNGVIKQTDRGYLTIMSFEEAPPHKPRYPLSENYYIGDVWEGPNYPTYATGGGYARFALSMCEQSYIPTYKNFPPGAMYAYDIEIYSLPENLILGWRYRGESDIMWRWIGKYRSESSADLYTAIQQYKTDAFNESYNHCPVGIQEQLRLKNLPDVWLFDGVYLPNFTGNNRALLRLTMLQSIWNKLNATEGAIDPRQLEFITCTKVVGELGLPDGVIGPVVPYYFNLSNPYVRECYASPPVSSGRVSVEVPKINYNWEGPCEPYAWDGYWTPRQYQEPTAPEIAAFKARYKKYFRT